MLSAYASSLAKSPYRAKDASPCPAGTWVGVGADVPAATGLELGRSEGFAESATTGEPVGDPEGCAESATAGEAVGEVSATGDDVGNGVPAAHWVSVYAV